MSAFPAEILELRVPAALEAVAPTLRSIGAHLRLRGLPDDAWSTLELGIAEGLNNAVQHGCAANPDAATVRVCWAGKELSIEIRDPGRFVPAPDWGGLPADALAECGRGGFLMKQAFARVEHGNDERGHVLTLATRLDRYAENPAGACEARLAIERATIELENTYETISGLRFLVSLLAKATTPAGLIEPALARLHEIDDFEFACVRMVRRAHLELERGWGALPAVPETISMGDDSAEARAVLTLKTQRIDSCSALPAGDPLHGLGGPAVVAPICFEDQRIGTITVVRRQGEAFFGGATVALVHTLAEFLGVAWSTAQLQARERDLEFSARELAVAAEMQARLLPESFPKRSDMHFSGACRSAQAVGGDFYDVFAVEGGTVVVIADAMGKGVPAAFVASVLRCAIRARADHAFDPGRLLTEVNQQITADLLALDIFITALVAFIPTGAGEMRIASAGHCPSMIRRGTGEVSVVEGFGIPIGVMFEAEYTTVSVPLAPRDAVVLFTDGLYEVGPAAELHLGLEWMRNMVAKTIDRDAADTVSDLLDATQLRAGANSAGDDRTLVVCERVA